MTTRSTTLYEEASRLFVGGVNSPVRARKSVGLEPLFISHAKGPYLYTEDGNALIDYVGAFGPHILGHAHPKIVKAIQEAAEKGTSYGACSALEIELAKRIQHFFPKLEKIRLVNSGTEACMSAIRLARGVTGRPIIVKFNGCYHGHADSLLVAAGSGNLTFGQPDSAGVPPEFTQHTAVLEYNDTASLETLFKKMGSQIAGVILEPVVGNMGVVLPDPNFLKTIRDLCTHHGALVICDEVMTGFRSPSGSAQADFNFEPDITCLGKVIGGGLPCGAYGASAKIMDHLSPLGPVYQAGTLSGNPIVAAAGIAALDELKNPKNYEHLTLMSQTLSAGIRKILAEKKLPYQLSEWGSLFTLFFTDKPVKNLADVKTSSTETFATFYRQLFLGNVYLAPSQFEANFVSCAHTLDHIEQTLTVMYKAL